MSLRAALVLWVLMATSCAAPEPVTPRFAVTFLTEADPGVPLGGVDVRVEGEHAGRSTLDGIVQMYVTAPEGTKVAIDYTCPQGYRHPGTEPTLLLRQFQAVDGNAGGVLESRLRCAPEERTAAFVVRADNGAGLPVMLDGEEVARTNEQGIAHFAVEGEPGTEYRVQIDTSSRPRLKPQNPVQHFSLADEDALFTIGQEFQLPARKVRRIFKIRKIN